MTISKIAVGLAAIALLASCGGSDHKKPKVNTAPVATPTSFSTQAETKYMGTLMGTDKDKDKLMFAVGASPTNGVLALTSDGKFSYTPNPEFTGSDKFTFNVSDGKSSSSTVEVNITVDLLDVSFSTYSRKAFNQVATENPLPLNSRKIAQDVTAENAYDDLLAQ